MALFYEENNYSYPAPEPLFSNCGKPVLKNVSRFFSLRLVQPLKRVEIDLGIYLIFLGGGVSLRNPSPPLFRCYVYLGRSLPSHSTWRGILRINFGA